MPVPGSQPVFVHERDADVSVIKGRRIAVLGYGNLGRPMALNLRDSGLEVVIGNVADDYRTTAAEDGFSVDTLAAATKDAQLVLVALPDQVIADCFAASIAPNLQPGTAVCFASGYVLAYDLVTVPAEIDVLMLAPRMLAYGIRNAYTSGAGFISYISVEHDATGSAREKLLALAAACGSLKRGAMELSAGQEAALDLFLEQSVGTDVGTAIQVAFEVAVAAGLPAEAVVQELYMSGEMAQAMQLLADAGFFGSVASHGITAAYGGFVRTMETDRAAWTHRYQQILDDIRSGGFARKFQDEQASGGETLNLIAQITAGADPMSTAERTVRQGLT